MIRETRDSTISAVIPTYQRRLPLLGAIHSVLAQSRAANEIVVVDDGSTDGTSDEVAARHGQDVRLVRQPNLGPAAARNAACRAAQGDVIAFLDSDNRWLPHHLETLVDLFVLHPSAVLVGTSRDEEFGHESPSDATLLDLAGDLLLERFTVGFLSSVAVRRDALNAAGGFDERLRYGEDTDLFLRLALQGGFALISATTIERGASSDSLQREGLSTGGYLGFLEWSANSVLAALDRSRRLDVKALRSAARARRATGAALTSLANDEPPETVRRHLGEIRRWAPDIDEVATVLLAAEWVIPRFDKIELRQRLVTTLLRASSPARDRTPTSDSI